MMGLGSDWANRVLRAADSEESQRQWAMYANERINATALDAWTTLRDHLGQRVREFNAEYEKQTGIQLLDFGGRNAFITVRKDRYPSYKLEILCELPQRRFRIIVRTAPDGMTEPVEKSETIALSLGSDDNLYLEFRGRRQSVYDIAIALAEDIFKACMPMP